MIADDHATRRRSPKSLGKLEEIESVSSAGKAGARARTHSGIGVDLRIAKPGAARQPAAALHRLRAPQRGAARGGGAPRPARLRVRHARRRDRRRRAPCASEQEVYELLGLAYIEPELRENRGELEAARDGGDGLPRADRAGRHPRRPAQPHGRLRRAQHDRGDGPRGARARLRVPRDHRPLGHPRLRQRRLARAAAPPDRAGRTRPTRASTGIELLAGSEVNILPDGSLDYEDELLARLDWVIASVHTSFGMGEQAMTERDDRRDRAPAGATRSATRPGA